MTDPLGAVNRAIDDLEQRFVASNAQLDHARAVGELMADIVGVGENEDATVRIEYAGSGVQDVVLNPRAMRMVSEDLAAALKQAFQDAAADFRAKTTDAMTAAGLLRSPEEQRQELEAAVSRLGGAQRELTASLRTAAEAVTRTSGTPRPQG